MDETSTRRAVPQQAMETRLVIERLRKMEMGDFVSHEELRELTGLHNQGRLCGVARSAINHLLADNLRFESVRGKGYKRINDEEIVECGLRDRRRIGRAARRAARKLSCVNLKGLSAAATTALNLAATNLSVLDHFSKEATSKKIEAKVKEASAALPVGKILEFMK